MLRIEWAGRIGKGSSAGAGWITLPAKSREGMSPGEYYDLIIKPEGQGPVRLNKNLKKNKKSWGFYLPGNLCRERNLIGQTVEVILEKTNYFPVKISTDKGVRIPAAVVESNKIQQGDLYEVEIDVNGDKIREIVLISVVNREDNINRADEYYFTVRMNNVEGGGKAGVKIIRKVKSMNSEEGALRGETVYLSALFPDMIKGEIDGKSMIIFKGNHVPIITPIKVKLEEIIHYFGHYHADGTKVGPGWSTNVSTPEQAIYSFKKYGLLILNHKLVYDVTFTSDLDSKKKIDEIKTILMQSWEKQANIELRSNRIYLRESTRKYNEADVIVPRKHNPIGSLRIRDNRGLVLELHLRLLGLIQSFVLTTDNINSSWQFLFGIIEGDGSVGGGRDRCRLIITCNKADKIIPELLYKIGITQLLRTDKYSEKSPNTIDYSFGLIPILKNLSILQKHLFRYYPKRRCVFIKRLLNTASVRYLLGETDNLFPLALHPLKQNDIINNNNVVERLKNLKKEIHS